MRPSGDKDLKASLGSFLCIGVSTTPGATAFTRMPSFAYFIARLRVIASIPPFVIIGTEAFTAAIGCSAIVVVMLTMLPHPTDGSGRSTRFSLLAAERQHPEEARRTPSAVRAFVAHRVLLLMAVF